MQHGVADNDEITSRCGTAAEYRSGALTGWPFPYFLGKYFTPSKVLKSESCVQMVASNSFAVAKTILSGVIFKSCV